MTIQTTFDQSGPDWSTARRVECPQPECSTWVYKRRLHAHIGSEDCAGSTADANRASGEEVPAR